MSKSKKKYTEILVADIVVDRPNRQRRNIGSIQDLADSINRVGLINPITVTRDNVLIAGERRLEACRLLSEDYKIPARFVDELDPLELQLIELEENLKRSELSWQDQVRAVKTMHDILSSTNENWTQEKTAKYLGYAQPFIAERISLYSKLGDDRIKKAESISNARNIVQREHQRAVDNELNSMMQIAEPETSTSKSTIENKDFCEWIKTYNGSKFNLIHCDFPYGINHQKSEQGNIGTGVFEGYADSEDVYWSLCSALCTYLNNIALPSCHVMFWFSMKFYSETIEFIESHSNLELSDERPLIWFKSDNKGIVSDVSRRPRNVYETALLFSRGDRKIITPVSNVYACPTSKSFHPSEKPEPMLRHFFRMFVDEHSEILDPTCGSGTAIRAGVSLSAKRALGLELNPEFAKSAQGELTRMKGLEMLSREAEV